MKNIIKTFAIAICIMLIACNQDNQANSNSQQAKSEGITQVEFVKAMDKYLETDSGQEKIGNSMQEYFMKQQKKAQEDRAKEEQKEMEEQMKNPVKIDIGNSPVKGPADAKITIVEFSDFECPFCSRGANTIEEVLKAYPKDVKVAFKNLPLAFHKNAKPAAIAALAAGRQGKFWEFHDVLFKNQRGLNEELYLNTAKELGLDIEKFKKDLTDKEIIASIEEDEKLARKLGISGTPGFSVNGVLVKGAYPFDHFKGLIDKMLAN